MSELASESPSAVPAGVVTLPRLAASGEEAA
ncbi:hypothetical protein FB470_002670 [Amycolatopsis thermophila]|uniref:Uncharacterized protein n=1 Tax=Amycolatopsis thermophila TaxID=206084 RepID=A0ABU0ETN8_9PSEU|nr:hypothetical protein [Amycolatopsis thermophila]